MPATIPRLVTIGEIVRQTGESLHRVEYVIRSRGIQPSGMAGNARIFAESAIDLVMAELQRIDSARVASSREGVRA